MPTHLSLLHTQRGLQGLQEVVVLFELMDTDLGGRESSLCTARGHTGLADSPLTGQQKVLVEMYRNVQKCTEIYRNVWFCCSQGALETPSPAQRLLIL